MDGYLSLLKDILNEGVPKDDRTGVGTLSSFGKRLHFDLQQGFPLVTTKQIHIKPIIHELLWFLKGDTNVHYLQENGVNIWNEWADKDGNLGPVYGQQWRRWEAKDGVLIDQIQEVIRCVQTNPDSRRLVVNAWNVADLPHMSLHPCHCLFQFYVDRDKLSCQLYQRSADIFLGLPFNIASYALLTMMMAQVCRLEPGQFIHTFGDAHLYQNHIEQAKLQLGRTPYPLPTMMIDERICAIDDFVYESFRLENYQCHEKIKAPIAI